VAEIVQANAIKAGALRDCLPWTLEISAGLLVLRPSGALAMT